MMKVVKGNKEYTGMEALEIFAKFIDEQKKKYPNSRDIRDAMNPYVEGVITTDAYEEIQKLAKEKYFGFTLGHVPFSAQSKSRKRILVKDIIKARIKNRNLHRFYNSFRDKELDIKITFFLGSKYKTSDLDNLGKELIDMIKGIVFPDDRQIKILTLKKEFVDKCKYRPLHEQAVVGIKIV